MSASSKAQTYAKVVFETALKDWLTGLGQVSATLSRSPGLQVQLTDPSKSFEARQAMLLPLLPADMPKPVRNFLLGMLANGDLNLLGEVVSDLRTMTAAAGGPRAMPAEVTSAVELTHEERLAIQNRLQEQFGSGLDFKFTVNPSILGGLVIRVGDKLLDTSIASRMAALRQSLGVAGS